MHGRAFADSSPFISTPLIFGGEWWHCSGMCSALSPSFCGWKNLPVLPVTLGHLCCCLSCNQHSCFYSHAVNSSKELMWLSWISSGDALFSISVPGLVPQATARIQRSGRSDCHRKCDTWSLLCIVISANALDCYNEFQVSAALWTASNCGVWLLSSLPLLYGAFLSGFFLIHESFQSWKRLAHVCNRK